MTLTCGSTNAGVAPPFCLEKQKEAIGGRREGKKGRTAREGCREAAGDGWMEGGRERGRGNAEGRKGGGDGGGGGGAMRGLSGSSKYLYCIMIRATVKEGDGEGRERGEI